MRFSLWAYRLKVENPGHAVATVGCFHTAGYMIVTLHHTSVRQPGGCSPATHKLGHNSADHEDRCQNNRANNRTGLHTNRSATPRFGSNGRASSRLPYLTVQAPTAVPIKSFPAKTTVLSNCCETPLDCSPFELCILQRLSL